MPEPDQSSHSYPWFVRGDIDGFFGLMIDNLMQFVVIAALCTGLCKMNPDFVLSTIFPGAAVSVLLGNIYYAYQARKLAQKTGRSDHTALPYGINTVSLFAYIFFIIAPVSVSTGDSMLAWKLGLAACFLSGVIEFAGAFVAERIRRITPRAALLSCLAGVAVTFISMDFALRIYANPLVAILPMGIIMITYFAGIKFPLRLSGGLLAVLVGTILAWMPGIGIMDAASLELNPGFISPKFCGGDLLDILFSKQAWQYTSVILPMGFINVIGSLQNIESAEAGGDSYETAPSLAVNGIGTIVGALFGSCFPTTIYIGHPGWKKLGARAGYSILNGAFMTVICFAGLMGAVLKIIPVEAGAGIVLWIGIVITAQAYQATPKAHAPAVAMGFFPAIAAWGVMVLGAGLQAGGTDWFSIFSGDQGLTDTFARTPLPYVNGLISLSQGFMFVCMILASISAFLIDRDFKRAAWWSFAGTVLSFFGFIHAFTITQMGIGYKIAWNAAPNFEIAYLMLGAFFLAFSFKNRKTEGQSQQT